MTVRRGTDAPMANCVPAAAVDDTVCPGDPHSPAANGAISVSALSYQGGFRPEMRLCIASRLCCRISFGYLSPTQWTRSCKAAGHRRSYWHTSPPDPSKMPASGASQGDCFISRCNLHTSGYINVVARFTPFKTAHLRLMAWLSFFMSSAPWNTPVWRHSGHAASGGATANTAFSDPCTPSSPADGTDLCMTRQTCVGCKQQPGW